MIKDYITGIHSKMIYFTIKALLFFIDLCGLTDDLDFFDGLHPCLSRGRRDPDSPKKKVSFDMYGKENLRRHERYSDYNLDNLLSKVYTSKYSSDIKDYDNLYEVELAKRRELKDRLFRAKSKVTDLHDLKLDAHIRNRNLLYFR